MNGMLQHHDMYREGVERHQAEARRWAEADRLGRLARANRPRRDRSLHRHHHSWRTHRRALRMHLHAMVSPLAMRMHHRA